MSEESIKELQYEPSGSKFTNERKRGALWEKQNPNIDWNTVDNTKMFDLQCDMIAWGKQTKRGTNWLRLIATIPYKEKKKKGNPF